MNANSAQKATRIRPASGMPRSERVIRTVAIEPAATTTSAITNPRTDGGARPARARRMRSSMPDAANAPITTTTITQPTVSL